MNKLTRRDFFCALVAVGVTKGLKLPMGFPTPPEKVPALGLGDPKFLRFVIRGTGPNMFIEWTESWNAEHMRWVPYDGPTQFHIIPETGKIIEELGYEQPITATLQFDGEKEAPNATLRTGGRNV